jgi:trehalose-phosphatase
MRTEGKLQLLSESPVLDQNQNQQGSDDDASLSTTKKKKKKVIASIVRLELLKSCPLLFDIILTFLREYPEAIPDIQFNIIGITASEHGSEYQYVKSHVAERLSWIYREFGHEVVRYREMKERHLTTEDRLELEFNADVFLIVPARDGLTLLPIEYTLLHQLTRAHNPGIVILSEFVSAVRVLNGAYRIHPGKVRRTALVIHEALTLDRAARMKRHLKNCSFALNQTLQRWAEMSIRDLAKACQSRKGHSLIPLGFGHSFRMICVRPHFEPFSTDSVLASVRKTMKRLIVLDLGGTLVPHSHQTGKRGFPLAKHHTSPSSIQSGLSPQIKRALQNLSLSSSQFVVFVVSGRKKEDLEARFLDLPNLGLGCEHGGRYLLPKRLLPADAVTTTDVGDLTNSRPFWEEAVSVTDWSWKSLARGIMELYRERTAGSMIEEKVYSISWQFSNADPDFGEMQSREFEDHLNAMLRGYPVSVLRGEGGRDSYIEVRLADISKGQFLRTIFHRLVEAHFEPDFCLVIGDDASDEPMFEMLDALDTIEHRYSVTVGRKPSSAQSYMDSVEDVGELLGVLGRVSIHETHSRSLQMINESQLADQGKAVLENTFTGERIVVDLGSDRSMSCLELGNLSDTWNISTPDLQALVSREERKNNGNERDGSSTNEDGDVDGDSAPGTQNSNGDGSSSDSQATFVANITPRYSWLFDSEDGVTGMLSSFFKRTLRGGGKDSSQSGKEGEGSEDGDGKKQQGENGEDEGRRRGMNDEDDGKTCQTFLQFSRSQVGLVLQAEEEEEAAKGEGFGFGLSNSEPDIFGDEDEEDLFNEALAF